MSWKLNLGIIDGTRRFPLLGNPNAPHDTFITGKIFEFRDDINKNSGKIQLVAQVRITTFLMFIGSNIKVENED